MSRHEEIRDLLPLAAAGELPTEEQRLLETHLAECSSCDAELEQWRLITGALSETPAVKVPEGLVERTRNRVTAAQAARREQLFSDVVLGFVMLFGWTMTAVVWLMWKLLSGGSLMEISLQGAAYWVGGTTLAVWITAGAAIVLLASKRNPMRRYQ